MGKCARFLAELRSSGARRRTGVAEQWVCLSKPSIFDDRSASLANQIRQYWLPMTFWKLTHRTYGASLYKSAESAWRGFYEAQGHGNAEVSLYLASRASGLVCGAVIPVDGGLATTA
jgi:hypothetical protein